MDTGNPLDRVYTRDLFTLQESPRLGVGVMEMTDTTFPWTLRYDEIDVYKRQAQELALTQEAGQFGGLIVGSMLGPTIVFTIPVGLGIIKAEDRPYLATGVLAGVITIPIGSFAGGLAAGFPVGMVCLLYTSRCV